MFSDKRILLAAILSSIYFVILFTGVPGMLNSNLVNGVLELFTIPMIVLQGSILASVCYRLIRKKSINSLQTIVSGVLSLGVILSFFFIS
ncbi:hypothetical protein SAMN05421820_109197 [Pedobacter steynii]|uniref:Uncharacterized protein n=1 Tax=Pedobacter steynii TaxID=430522 RepID=A0A1H0E676_9SPHI|nr:hypothetical protein [Pedobacter steynii]NQX41929.1 hypothetical protein [Pedobacter steynii]SDN77768.1 hypothetical protein SAMN05421820_109197 [Pedobacter steynii]